MSIGKAINVEWDWCIRCGREFHVSKLIKQQGMLLCTVKPCYDDLSNQYRPLQISESLRNDREGVSDKPDMFSDPGEVVFQ